MKKIMVLVLCLAMMLSGCVRIDIPHFAEPKDTVRAADLVNLTFTLEQSLIDEYYDLLRRAEELAVAAEDLELTEQVSDELEEVYWELSDQYQIAYILYCVDQTDEQMKAQYMDCVDITAAADQAYNEMCKRVWLSETPFRDTLFADWSQEDIDRLLAYNDEIARLEKRNKELTVEFRELGDWEMATEMIPLYNETVRNNNRIAQLYGYGNYYEYAYDVIYQRDYEMDQIRLLRQYTAKYLPDICRNSGEVFAESYEQLSNTEQRLIGQLVERPYNAMKENFVELYLQSIPQSSGENMQDMFDRQKVAFSTAPGAYQGAFTTFIDAEPYCYFSEDYADSETVVHELGHYYGSLFTEAWSQPMDLAETQSQGNEWLFTHFMGTQLSVQGFECLTEYKLLSDLSYIMCFVMIDEFEEQVYSHENAGNLTVDEYEAIMEKIAENYGGIQYITEEILDIQNYWRYVVLESPVYYISYAVSGIAAINLFTVAQQDAEQAWEIYRKLIEEPLEDAQFLESIRYAGLTGPFEETVYLSLSARYA